MKDATSMSTDLVYKCRFKNAEVHRNQLWKTLCRHFFQKYIPTDSCVLDVAAGHCEFINNIIAKHRIAVDINSDIHNRVASGVQAVESSATDLQQIDDKSVDVVFVSNFFEHISKPDIVSCLRSIHRVLRPSGRLLILQPNYRYCSKNYWMFFDHITPLDDRALVEVLELLNFDIVRCTPRFLPYSTKQKLPQSPLLLRLYLKLPIAWQIWGSQAFVYAKKSPNALS